MERRRRGRQVDRLVPKTKNRPGTQSSGGQSSSFTSLNPRQIIKPLGKYKDLNANIFDDLEAWLQGDHILCCFELLAEYPWVNLEWTDTAFGTSLSKRYRTSFASRQAMDRGSIFAEIGKLEKKDGLWVIPLNTHENHWSIFVVDRRPIPADSITSMPCWHLDGCRALRYSGGIHRGAVLDFLQARWWLKTRNGFEQIDIIEKQPRVGKDVYPPLFNNSDCGVHVVGCVKDILKDSDLFIQRLKARQPVMVDFNATAERESIKRMAFPEEMQKRQEEQAKDDKQ